MFITTAGRTNEEMSLQANKIAKEFKINFVKRNKRSISAIQELDKDDCIVVGKERLELYPFGEKEPFFFHPNSAMFRIKRLMKGEHDPFIDSTGLVKGMTLLDCTLGLASDSIVASFAVGNEGKVVGIEGNPFLAFIVNDGLKRWDSGLENMNLAMKRIQVKQYLAYDYLKKLHSDSFDCVYFDPMFEEHILESDGIKSLTRFAVFDQLTEEVIEEAKRVAKKRVVLKDHFRSNRFEKLHFDVIRRKSAKFHFGVLNL